MFDAQALLLKEAWPLDHISDAHSVTRIRDRADAKWHHRGSPMKLNVNEKTHFTYSKLSLINPISSLSLTGGGST